MKPSGIGGMAVMEGVMMKNKDVYAVAVRKPNNEIAVEKSTHKDISDKVKLFKLPVFRGMLAFVDSMLIGVKVLNYSASFFEEEEELTEKQIKKLEKKKANKTKKNDKLTVEEVSVTDSEAMSIDNTSTKDKNSLDQAKEDKSNALFMALAVVISIIISVSLFMVLPVVLTNLLSSFITNGFLIAFIEGIVRLAIFVGYIILASRMPEIKRVFMYHGAEHKTINCLENGFELTVENVKWQTKQHKRCGTSFMLLVMLISLVFFMFIPTGNLLWRILSRVILVPFIAGVSYEFIRLAGKSESRWVTIVSQPGLWMQGLTTKEPDDAMIEVAIQSVSAVFDWKTFLETSASEEPKEVKNVAEKSSSKDKKQSITIKQDTVVKQVAAVKSNVSVKPEATKKQESAAKNEPEHKEIVSPTHSDSSKRNPGNAPVSFKPVNTNRAEEEDDEILKALDKFFDGPKESNKTGEN
ncbi:MAG: DUF1385 domain-containing protein [Mobilitalea sp.]